MHWIHPIHKNGKKSDAQKYRGVHLTSQVSKIIERAIGHTFLPWVHRNSAFGANQYAYTTSRSHKDALAVNVCRWILSLEAGNFIGLYRSDVKAAFDRVRRSRMVSKLRVSGLHQKVVKFLESWLEERKSKVVVGGQRSSEQPLRNSVFQGTVLGPPLWNLFYCDASRATESLGFEEVVFADDFNCDKEFPGSNTDEEAWSEMEICQTSLHSWGRANSVTFDSTKEGFHILHKRRGCGGDFKQLGVFFDTSLTMDNGIAEIAKEAGWRLRAVLRPKRFFRRHELM